MSIDIQSKFINLSLHLLVIRGHLKYFSSHDHNERSFPFVLALLLVNELVEVVLAEVASNLWCEGRVLRNEEFTKYSQTGQ